MNKLYRFHWDCGRMGDLSGLFVADDADVGKAIGKRIYFGEVLGKHSEIEGPLEEGDVRVVTDDQGFVEKFMQLGCSTGFDPLQYIVEDEEDGDS